MKMVAAFLLSLLLVSASSAVASAQPEGFEPTSSSTSWVIWVKHYEHGPWQKTLHQYLAESVCWDQCEFLYQDAYRCSCRPVEK